jgi:hypothetical protein
MVPRWAVEGPEILPPMETGFPTQVVKETGSASQVGGNVAVTITWPLAVPTRVAVPVLFIVRIDELLVDHVAVVPGVLEMLKLPELQIRVGPDTTGSAKGGV